MLAQIQEKNSSKCSLFHYKAPAKLTLENKLVYSFLYGFHLCKDLLKIHLSTN